MRTWVQFLALLSGLLIQHCHKLWYRSHMRLGSGVAVAVVQTGSYSSDLAPGLGTPKCCGFGPQKTKDKKKKKERKKNTPKWYFVIWENYMKFKCQCPSSFIGPQPWFIYPWLLLCYHMDNYLKYLLSDPLQKNNLAALVLEKIKKNK